MFVLARVGTEIASEHTNIRRLYMEVAVEVNLVAM
jgi:hypothetical protein